MKSLNGLRMRAYESKRRGEKNPLSDEDKKMMGLFMLEKEVASLYEQRVNRLINGYGVSPGIIEENLSEKEAAEKFEKTRVYLSAEEIDKLCQPEKLRQRIITLGMKTKELEGAMCVLENKYLAQEDRYRKLRNMLLAPILWPVWLYQRISAQRRDKKVLADEYRRGCTPF